MLSFYYIFKMKKYNMSLYIFNNITKCNKFLLLYFIFFHQKSEDSYYYILSQIYELFTCIREEKEHEVIVMDKKDVFIADLQKVLFCYH